MNTLYKEPSAMLLQLRYYQREAIDSAYDHLRNRKDNPCIVLPTGGGKTAVIATICNDAASKWGGRVLVLSHVKELISQTVGTLQRWYPSLSVGAYSAGLGRRETSSDVIVAGIQSVHNKGLMLAGERGFNLVLVDEAHRIPTDGDGMYQSLLSDLTTAFPATRVIGLTATPYRLGGGYVCSPDHFLNEVCYEAGVRELIAKGYLSKLTSKQTTANVDTSGFAVRNGEFRSDDMSAAFGDQSVVDAACTEIIERTKGRKSVLMFCCDVAHAENVASTIEKMSGQRCGLITGKTPPNARDATIQMFKDGALRWLANVNVLTEGFDATRVDCVCLLRSTLSPGLYYQMVGRGLRKHEGKEDCLVLDFGNNITRHGCIDAIKVDSRKSSSQEPPVKVCPQCDECVPAGSSVCPACYYVFPPPEDTGPRHDDRATNAPITSDQVRAVRYEVTQVGYTEHEKRNAAEGHPKTLRVTYYAGLDVIAEEWVCVEHAPGSFAQRKASQWWCERGENTMPASAHQAAWMGGRGLLAEPIAVHVCSQPGSRFPEIVKVELGPKPQMRRVEINVDDWGDASYSICREPGEDDEPLTHLADTYPFDTDNYIPF